MSLLAIILSNQPYHEGTRHGHRAIAELLALKDAPDDALLDQVEAIGVTAARSILYDEAKRLRYTDRQAKLDCIALMDRINELIRPA
jgi:hypothetical protein